MYHEGTEDWSDILRRIKGFCAKTGHGRDKDPMIFVPDSQFAQTACALEFVKEKAEGSFIFVDARSEMVSQAVCGLFMFEFQTTGPGGGGGVT